MTYIGSSGVNYLSLRIKLDDIVVNRDYEIKVLENIRYCRKIVGQRFRVIFWNKNLSEKDCENFIRRNEKLLFEVHTKITKGFGYTWFLISAENTDESKSRYQYKGDVINGISEYLKLAKFLINKKNDL